MRYLFQLLIVVLLPVILALANARILMTSSFARWEYAKPGFPDPAQVVPPDYPEELIVPIQDRQPIVDTTLAYVLGAGDENLIADNLRFADGRRAYNEREVRHLTDVRVLMGRITVVQILTGLGLLLSIGFLVWTSRSGSVAQGLAIGSGLTVAIVGVIGLIAAFAFRFYFVRFHRIFFQGDTWLFPSTDTLIQIFPEKFWYDASLLIVLLTLVEAVVIGVLALVWLGIRRRQGRRQFARAT